MIYLVVVHHMILFMMFRSKNVNYFRLDGQTKTDKRKENINSFNDPRNTSARLYLVSTKAGGIGINLVGANRFVPRPWSMRSDAMTKYSTLGLSYSTHHGTQPTIFSQYSESTASGRTNLASYIA